MREEELQIDRSCHTVYSRRCRDVIMEKVCLHYGPEAETVFEQVQHQYERYLADFIHQFRGSGSEAISRVCG